MTNAVPSKGQRIQEHRDSSLALLLISWTSRLLASKLLWTDEIFSTPPGPNTRPWHNYRKTPVVTTLDNAGFCLPPLRKCAYNVQRSGECIGPSLPPSAPQEAADPGSAACPGFVCDSGGTGRNLQCCSSAGTGPDPGWGPGSKPLTAEWRTDLKRKAEPWFSLILEMPICAKKLKRKCYLSAIGN